MQRREFCKLIAAAAAAGAIPANGQSAAGPTAGFNKLHQTYEEFCATPESERIFYSLVDGKIVEKKLNTADWSATAWGEPPELPGGSWDGVPMQAPIEGLNGDGPYQANWDSLLQYEAPEWYRDAKFGIWAHWSPQCVPEFGDWYARNMYQEGSPDYNFQNPHYGHPSEFGYKDLCAQWTLLNWEPECADRTLQKCGSTPVYRAGQSPRRVRCLGFEASAVELRSTTGRIATWWVNGPRQPRAKGCDLALPCTRLATGGGFRPRTAPTKAAALRACRMTGA